MQNFGRIKNVFNNLIVENVIKKDENTKKLFKKYLKAIKESEILKTQFLVYNNIENRIDSDSFSANIFISENVKLLEKYKPSDILNENKKLVGLLKGSESKLDELYELSELHESLSNLIMTERNAKNIDKITEEIKRVTNYIVSNKPKEVKENIQLPISVLSKIMVEKFNQKYSDLEKEDKEVLKSLIASDFETQKNLYSNITNECLELIENLIKESDTNSKEKLERVKSKLVEDSKEIVKDNFIDKFSKLIELKKNLNP